MEARKVLVTGGTGTLGSRVVERLRAAGHEARVLSRGGRPGTVQGDLLTGEGVEEAVRGVDAIVHAAQSPARRSRQVAVGGTELLLRAAQRVGAPHFLYISIVGIGCVPLSYNREKLDAETLVERSGVPWTILRATQFHDLMLRMVRPLSRFPLVAPVPKGLLFQPVDAGEVADRLVELALDGPAGRVPDIGGPEVRTVDDIARAYLEATGSRKRAVAFPLPGKTARAVRSGALTCPENRYGKVSWEEFLREEMERHPE
jgi:uncharacterized protein YbjT (DUF2867 family)